MTTPDSTTASGSSTVPELLRAVVARYAQRPALEANGVTLTYAELDRLSNRVAHALLERGGDEPVAMVAPLEAAPIIAMIGALKAGRVFAPLDPRDPPARIRLVCEHLGALMLSPDALTELSSDREDDPLLCASASAPTLVYFTSGSTGRPKGTIKSHERLTSVAIGWEFTPKDRLAIIVPLAFAGSITPIFGTLLSGATGCMFDPAARGIGAFAEWSVNAEITVLQTAPSALRALARELEERRQRVESVRLAILVGEPCHWEQLEGARRVLPEATIANVYGTSEAGYVAATVIDAREPLDGDLLPFRRCFPGQTVEIVDESGRPLAAGEAGEILVRGKDVSLGYWKEPHAAARRFGDEVGGVRSVRTGDRGRLLPDGSLEHLGRLDLRVKVHGQMVDLEEVEHVLTALPGVGEAVVSPVPGQDGDTKLVAHVLAKGEAKPRARDLRLGLAESLPPFMIPSAFLDTDVIPRSGRGKIDRDALRQAARSATPSNAAYKAPRNQREHALAEIVAEVFGLDRVGTQDDVFELGADSMSLVELLAVVDERLGVELTPGDVVESPTIKALATRVSEKGNAEERPVVPLHSGGSGAPFFCAPSGGAPIFLLRPLARALDRPTYTFVPRGFSSRQLPDRSVERLAARNLSALRTIQPSGPYLIGGHSFGGVVAFEMAQQLCSAGETVSLLALLDPATSPPLLRQVRWITTASRAGRAGRLTAAWRLGRRAGGWVAHSVEGATAGLVTRPPDAQLEAFFYLNQRMGRRYRPSAYGGRTILLRTGAGQSIDSLSLSRSLTGEKQVVDVPGGHVTMLREPHVGPLAAILREALATADPDRLRP